jgi:hypothetical protein
VGAVTDPSFARHASIDLSAALRDGEPDRDALAARARAASIRLADNDGTAIYSAAYGTDSISATAAPLC